MSSPPRFPVSRPVFAGREREYVLDCLDRIALSGSDYVTRLEHEFAAYHGTTDAVACSSGAAALHLMFLALGLRPGDAVLIPALSYIATANAVRYVGASPIFCDVDRETWNIDPLDVERHLARINGRQRVVVMPVHLYGVPADMGALTALQQRHPFALVEDACEAHGADICGAKVGSMGQMGAFSFYGNKILTAGEGGIITVSDAHLAAQLRLYRGQGQDLRLGRYVHSVVGYNYRLTNIQAAIALAQLEAIEYHVAERRRVLARYRANLSAFGWQSVEATHRSADWLATVLLPVGVDRGAVMARLEAAGIETRPAFPPIPSQPAYAGTAAAAPPVTRDISARALNLPTYADLDNDDIDTISDSLTKAVQA